MAPSWRRITRCQNQRKVSVVLEIEHLSFNYIVMLNVLLIMFCSIVSIKLTSSRGLVAKLVKEHNSTHPHFNINSNQVYKKLQYWKEKEVSKTTTKLQSLTSQSVPNWSDKSTTDYSSTVHIPSSVSSWGKPGRPKGSTDHWKTYKG